MKILIIDDSRFLRMTNERALSKAGHSVVTASDGEEGLRLAREHKPDLVILDMMLPKLSGPQVLQALRIDAQTATTPVMVLTSLSQCNEERLKGDGATSYYQKSLLQIDTGHGRLLEIVEQLLAQSPARATGAN